MTRIVLVLMTLPTLAAVAAARPAEESSDKKDHKETYVIMTSSESSPEELFRRYPELASSWDELARFNLLRSPGTTIEVPRDLLATDRILAKIAGVYGEAEVRRSFDDRYIPVVENLLLREGDLLRTWRHSGARILFDGGSQVVLRSHSKARLIALPSTVPSAGTSSKARIRLELVEGNIWTRTLGGSETGFLIETPTANTMTRGTDFRLKVEAGQATRLEVLEGEVELEAGDQTVVVPSRQGAISGGDTPTLEPLPQAPEGLIAPHAEEVFRASSFDVVFRWTPVPGAQSYRLEISRDTGFFDLAEERLTGARTDARITGLEPGTYFWRVSALSPSGFEGPPAAGSYFVFVEKRP
ncbi:MAG: FecR domain-containing protein [Vicinamibacteria bacterium]